MKRLSKKILMPLCAMTLAASSIAAYAPVAYASTVSVPSPRWSYLTMIRGSMKVDDKNIAKISVACNSDAFDTDKIEAKCELQQLDGSWKTIKTWREENNGTGLLYHKEWAIAKNYSYRLKVTAYTYKDSVLLESATEYFDYGYYQ